MDRGPLEAVESMSRAPEAESRPRLYVVDDHPVIRAFLSQHLDLPVCGWSSDAGKALSEIPTLRPDIVIIDLSLNDSHGFGLIRELLLQSADLKILVYSAHEEQLYAPRVLEAGALGYICKKARPEQLTEAVRRVLHGEIYLSPEMMTRALMNRIVGRKQQSGSSLDGLSDRELQVFEMIGRGAETKQIAEQLKLDTKTVETYRARIKEKLNLRSAPALMRAAFQFVQDGSLTVAAPAPGSPPAA